MKRRFLLIFACLLVPSVFLSGMVTTASEAVPAGDPEPDAAALLPEAFIRLDIPLFSPIFADIPVALVNEEPISLRDLERAILAQKQKKTHQRGNEEVGYLKILERLVNSWLAVEEARNIGLDETEEMKAQREEFELNLLQKLLITSHLEGLAADPDDVAEVYQQISREVKLDTITFERGAEAQKFIDEVQNDDFDKLAEAYVGEGLAEQQRAEEYVKLKDLRLQIRQQAFGMDIGDVSSVYRTEDGFLLFRLVDSRFVEDQTVKQEAEKIALDTLRKQKAMEYSNALVDKYVMFDEDLYDSLDFDKDLNALMHDERILATVKTEEPVVITVADLAAKLQMKFFHGADKAQKLNMVNTRKESEISNMLFRYTSELEAQRLGLDQTADFRREMAAFERSSLFSAFMNKVILPDVKLTAEEVRTYYDEHIEDYSSPEMLKIKSLVFKNRQDAESALDKLERGADYKWVSANATGFVPADTEGVLPFDQNLLSLTALPDDLRKDIAGVAPGNTRLYAPSEGDFFYVLLVEELFPPEPEPYEQVKSEVATVVFNMKSEKLLNEYTAKLKEVYETVIYLTDGA